MCSEQLLRDLHLSLAFERAKIGITEMKMSDAIEMIERAHAEILSLRTRCDRLESIINACS